MKTRQPDVDIEINYDAEMEEFGSETDAGDARFVRVRIKNRNIVPGSLELLPPDPEDQTSGDFLACPVQIRAGTPDYTELYEGRDRTARFRAELDLPSIMLAWTTVQEAAKEPRRFCIKVTLEANQRYPKEDCIRYGRVKINLNTIRWTWTPLIRDREGAPAVQNGDAQDDTPIEVDIDGTDKNGFRLEVERGVLREDGEYEAAKSDFTHYLSPDGKVNQDILFLTPEPWDPTIQPTQQIVTTWWTKNLPADHPLLNNLPMETSIRVQAFKEHSIKKRAPKKYLPEDLPRLAIRELPLHLGLRKWEATVITPDPQKAPILLEGDRPWEECIHAEVQLFAGINPKSVENTIVEWSLPADSQKVGTVSYGGQTNLTSGEWKVDDQGRVEFIFCPTRGNALFLDSKQGTQYYANFNVRLKQGRDPDKAKIPSSKTPNDKKQPSFKLDWAPKFDLAVFKLPFFIDPTQPLDLETDPKPDEVKAIPLSLSAEETEGYQNIFRRGGTILIRPVVKWDTAGDGNTTDIPLQHYRLAVGDQAREAARKKGITESRKLLSVDTDSSGAWPDTVTIPSQPNENPAEQPVTVHPEIPLHPEIVERFRVINEKSTKLDSTVASNAGLTEKSNLAGWTNRFHDHGLKFGEQAVRYFCESPSEILCTNGKGIRAGLGAMAGFFDQATAAWDLLGDAIGLHRQIYKRFEDTLINFYFDVFGWDPIKKKLEPLRKAIEGLPGGKYLLDLLFPDRIVARGYDKFQSAVLKSRLAAWVGSNLQALSKKNKDAIEETEKAIVAAERASEEAGRGFDKEVQKCGDHAANLQQEVDAFIQTAQTVQNQAQQLRASGVSGQALRTQNQSFLAQLNAAWARVLETRTRWRASLGSAIDHFKAGASAASQKTAASLEKELQNQNQGFLDTVSKEYSEIVDKEDLEAEKLKEFMDELTKGPDRGQGLAARSEATAALHDSLASGNATLGDLVNQYDQTWRGLAQRYEALSGKPFGPGVPVPNVGDEVSSYLERQVAPEVQKAHAESASAKENANDLVGRVNDITGRRFDRILDYWLSFFKVLEDRMEDAESQANMPLQGQMDEFLSKNEPATPDSSDLLGELVDTVISAVNGVKNLIMNVLSKIMSLVKQVGWGILWLIILLLRGLFAVISLLLTFVRGALGKWAELIASVFEWFREAVGGKFSALTSDAFTTSSGVLKDSGSPALFDFPYRQEIDLSRRVKSAAEEYSKQPVWVDQAKQGISALFRSGYEDYYPAQVQATRAFFFNLCQQALNRNNLEKPCLDSNDESARFGFLVLDAQHSLKRQVANYQRALDDAGKDSTGFAAGFWAELKDARGFNALDLDIIISWVGWSSALVFRFTGCVLALAGVFTLLFTAPVAAVAAPVEAGVLGLEAVTVFGLFKAADFTDFITTSSRTILGLVSYYPYATAYPRDAVLMPALFYAMAFRPADTRFNASDVNSIIGESHIDLGY
jgi:hypothetical protein